MTDEIILEGARYFHAHGAQNYQNPYPINSDEFNRFERGWTQALKKSYIFSEEHPRPNKSEYRIISTPEHSDPKQKNSDYKNRKG